MNVRTFSTRLVSLVNGLDDTDSDGLSRVTNSETTEEGTRCKTQHTVGTISKRLAGLKGYK